MNRFIFICFMLSCSCVGRSQFFSFGGELFLGSNYSKKLKGFEDITVPNNGLTMASGVKGILNLGRYANLSLTVGANRNHFTRRFFQFGMEFSLFHIKKINTTFFLAGGIEELAGNDVKLPIYFGLRHNLDDRIAWILRIRPPLGIDTHYLDWTNNYMAGIEFGLRFGLFMKRKPKVITKFGNPFFLR